MTQFKEVYKDEISLLVEAAIGKLDKVDAQAEGQKKHIVVDLAKDIEGKIPIDTICMEIVDKLHGKVSPRFIRECLDEKYKQKDRVDNARKQKRQIESKIDNKLAAQPPLNAVVGTNGITILDADYLIPLSGNDEDNKSSATIIDISSADITIAESPYQLKEQEKLKNQNNSDLKECSSCKDLYSKNLELEEALAKSTQMTTADKIRSAPNTDNHNKETDNGVCDFEFPMPYKELQKYMASLFKKMGGDGEVWFRCSIDKKAGKVISSNFGRLNQQWQ